MIDFILHKGDCAETLRGMPDNSIDSVVTDPPYGLSKEPDAAEVLRHWLNGDDYKHTGSGFMGKSWDSFVPGPSVWREVRRVLKPGGHALVFAGSRTQDLMSMALRLAGFEIRDTAMWLYSTGFPKSLNLDNLKGTKTCGCMVQSGHEAAKQKTEHNMRSVRGTHLQETLDATNQRGEVLQPSVQEQGTSAQGREKLSASEIRPGEPSMEGRGHSPQEERELCVGEVCESAGRREANGQKGWLRNGTQVDHGSMDWSDATAQGGSTSYRPQSSEQLPGESGAVAGQQESQVVGAWPICSGCGLPRLPDGLGTALKPAYEPIIIARKPLVGTVADNVLRHGTGAINVDGCRVPSEKPTGWGGGASLSGGMPAGEPKPIDGRWPANILHDGLDEEWARYFYCAKASKADREEGLEHFTTQTVGDGRAVAADNAYQRGKTERRNTHPTVKPTELMRYLCRLVTPPGGTVLDPFAGSGSTGKAALLEGFSPVLCEMTDEYWSIIEARCAHALLRYVEENY